MIEIKLKNPNTGEFEECSTASLTTPRKINNVEFDGSKDITIEELEIVVQPTVPTNEKNKLWISGNAGVPAQPLSVEWANVTAKPLWVGYMPTTLLTGLGGKVVTVKQDETGYEYTPLPSGSLNTISVKPGVTGLTATKTGDNVELDASYPSSLVQSATGYKILKSISSNKLLGATIVAGTGLTISETDGETIDGLVTKRLTINGASSTWDSITSKPAWVGYMPTTPLTGLSNKLLGVNATETGYEYKSFDASTINYHNVTYNTVEKALDKLLYVPVTVGISGGGTYEIGTTINTVNLTWSTNKDILTQSINNGIGSLATEVRSYTHSGQTITTNRIYTITVNDGTQDAVSSTSVNFLYKRYWGVTSAATITDANIFSLNKELSGTRTQTRTFDCSGGRYFWIIYPQSYGNANFKVGGLSFSDMNLEVRTITNESGASVTLNIYRVNGIQTGSAINVEVL